MAGIKEVKTKKTTLLLGGKERELLYTLESFGEMEEAYGSIEAAFQALQSSKVKDMAFFLWAGLIHEDEEITVRQVMRIIPIQDMGYVMEKIGEAMESQTPAQPGENNPN